jgi:hypothetical protein
MFISLILIGSAVMIASAQDRSKDCDKPMLITAKEFTDDLDGSNDEYY